MPSTASYTYGSVAALLGCCLLGEPASAERGCRGEGELKSANSNAPTTIHFVNRIAEPITIYWLDFTGKRVFYNQLSPDSAYDQQTYFTHPWIAVTAAGVCIGPFLPENSGTTVIIKYDS